MNEIKILKIGITDLDTDAIVNAANEGLVAGSGVCGAIFKAAGYGQLQEACNDIGHCDTGSAVITEGFDTNAKHIIHAVDPKWSGGYHNESKLLYDAYWEIAGTGYGQRLPFYRFPFDINGGVRVSEG